MARVLLTKVIIKNFGPIQSDEVVLDPLTYFVGRNNAGKSHYLKAIEILLAARAPSKSDIATLQNDKTKEIYIEGHFTGVQDFTSLVSTSNHKKAIEEAIKDGVLKVVRVLDPNDEEKTNFGVMKDDGTIHNVQGFPGNLLKVLPDPISIVATADTVDELKSKENTALSKLKKEVMITFLDSLREKTQTALTGLNDFLHSENEGVRSAELTQLERNLKAEFEGEFSDVIPSIEFQLPDEEVITKEMKIFLDDGHRSEVEQKGHGLQRATLLALFRLLAKHGQRYQSRPTPIFLIGEFETFLHPYAQKQLAGVLNALVGSYQIITTTHSPFIITPEVISGYRRVRKISSGGTKTAISANADIDIALVKRNLERRGNLEGLFADRIILIEGDHDDNFFTKLLTVFSISLPAKQFTLFVKTNGKEELRQTRRFYTQMNFDDVAIVCDLDCLFSNDMKNLLKEVGMDENIPQQLRQHIDWTESGDPSLKYVIEKINEKGEPTNLEQLLTDLAGKRIFVFRKGSPEMYYANNNGEKNGWVNIQTEADLLEPAYLKDIMNKVLM
jgi:AAA15 family ATPase/GTPase